MSSLIKKGFVQQDGYKDHYFFTYYTKNGKKTDIFTKLSRGSSYKTIGDPLLASMAKQCRLDKKNFLNLIDCPLDRDAYENILTSKNDI